jgi:hypothetical protein
MICSYLCKRAYSQHLYHLARYRMLDTTYLELLGLVVACVHSGLAVARLAQQLPAIDRERRQVQSSVRILHPLAVLPLHDTTGTRGVLRVRDGAVIGLLVVSILSERVGDAGALRLDEIVVEGVVEALVRACQYKKAVRARWSCRTGPVRVLLDLVLHVPTISLGQVPCAVAKAARPARPAREYFMMCVCRDCGDRRVQLFRVRYGGLCVCP